jgi:hypothetical protein
MQNSARPKGENDLLLFLLGPQLADLRDRFSKQPECRLMWAVLQDAIDTYMKYSEAKRIRHQNRFREAKEWIDRDDLTWLFSFPTICHTLGLDPNYVREGLRRWQKRRRSGVDGRPSEIREAA